MSKKEISGEIKIEFDYKAITENPINLKHELEKMNLDKSMETYYDALKSIVLIENTEKDDDLEMPNFKTERIKEEKRIGKLINNNFIKLDEPYNSATTFRVPDGYINKFNYEDAESLYITLIDGKISTIDLLSNYENSIKQDIKSQKDNSKNRTVKKDLIPESGIYLTEFQRNIFDVASKMLNAGDDVIFTLVGAAGNGKTTLPELFAKENELDIFTLDCSTIDDALTWFLIPELKNSETVFTLTEFSEHLIRGNCVIVLDEISRTPGSWVSNALLPLFDDRKGTRIRNIPIKVGSRVAFFWTENIGYDYTGVGQIDKALRRRKIGTILVDSLPNDVEIELLMKRRNLSEQTAIEIVKVISRLRKDLKEYSVNVSTATSLNIGAMCKHGMDIRSAFQLAVGNDAHDEPKVQKCLIDALNLVAGIR